MIWELFSTFLVIGFVSFGGGYAMIPVIEMRVTELGWLTTQQFTDVIAVAGMSPGPIATNTAIFVGYQVYGLPGAVFSAIGMVLPSLLIILLMATILTKINDLKVVQSGFYGLRPVITGLIIYAAIKFVVANDIIHDFSIEAFSLVIIFGLSLFALTYFKIHPLLVIISSGVIGVIVFS